MSLEKNELLKTQDSNLKTKIIPLWNICHRVKIRERGLRQTVGEL